MPLPVFPALLKFLVQLYYFYATFIENLIFREGVSTLFFHENGHVGV